MANDVGKSEHEAVDVVVIGGGVSGVMAAIAVARSGFQAVIIEPSNVLGGQGTVGGVAGFCGDTSRVNAPFAEMIERLTAHNMIDPYDPTADRRAYDLEGCGFVLQELVRESGVDVYLHSRVIDAHAEGGRIDRVVVATAAEVKSFVPKMVIDASGLCVVAGSAGLPVMHEPSMKQLPMGLYFTLWDTGHAIEPKLMPGCPTWQNDDDIPMTTLHPFPSGKVEVKMKVVGFDAADGKSLSEAEMHGRRQMMGLIYHLQTKGYRGVVLDRHVLASVSRQIGIRESRRIVGDYVLTEDDVTHSARFEDAVAVGTYHLDYHWPDRVERAGTGITTMVEPYQIPLRCMIARGSANLLVPGRAASGDQMAMSSYRVMATCAQMGFAAGLAASQACEQSCVLSDLDIPRLQNTIESQGQSLNLTDYGDYLRQDIICHEHLFEEKLPFGNCHASTLVQLTGGRYLAAWFCGSEEGEQDVRIWTSMRDRGQWSPPQPGPIARQAAHWNPVLFVDDHGVVQLYFKVGPTVEAWQTWRCESCDDGQTWSVPVELVPGDVGGRGPVKNKPIRLGDGTWLAPASLEDMHGWRAFVDRSTDGGKTWVATAAISLEGEDRPGDGVIQPAIWESSPGQVHMLLRSTRGLIYRSDSGDAGLTWGMPYPTDVPNNNSGLDVARLYDGTLALVCNPVACTGLQRDRRSPLSLFLSADNGETWTCRLDLETDDGEYSYPAIIPNATGMAITYTWRRERIAFWLGSIERVPIIQRLKNESSICKVLSHH